MSGAYIRGMGLSCALGMDAEQCISAMLHEARRAVSPATGWIRRSPEAELLPHPGQGGAIRRQAF